MWAAVLALLACCSAPVTAQQMSLQSHFTYTLSEIGLADGSSESSGIFSPWYLLTLRGPLIGGTDTQAEFGITGYNSGDPEASIDQRNYRVTVLAQGDRLSLLAVAARDANRSTVVRPDGTDLTSLAVSNVYSLNGSLRYPSYPTVNFQYQRSTVRGEDEQMTDSTIGSLGARYDWGALQFFADQEKHEASLSQTVTESARYGLSLDRSVLPTVRFRLDHHVSTSRQIQRETEMEAASENTTLRISALPTPFLVADGELSFSKHQAIGGVGGTTGSGWGHGLHLRSEVLPGVRLDMLKNGQSYETPLGTVSTDQTSVNVGIRLHPTTTILAHWGKSDASDPARTEDRLTRGDKDRRVAVTSSLSPRMELFAEHGVTSQGYREGIRDTTRGSIGVRGYVSPALTVGAALGAERRDVSLDQGTSSDSVRHLDLEASWLPGDRWRLGAGLSVVRSRTIRSSSSVTPYLDASWEMDPASTLTLRYFAQTVDYEDISKSADTRVAVAARVMRRLPNAGTLEVNYDYRKAVSSLFAWERVVELRYGRSF